MTQHPLFHDTPEEAMTALVFALGGWQKAAAKVWPADDPVRQGDRLRRVLTGQGRDRLSLREWIALLRAGAEIDVHTGIAGMCSLAGYETPEPLDPQVEQAKATQAVEKATETLERALALLGRANTL